MTDENRETQKELQQYYFATREENLLSYKLQATREQSFSGGRLDGMPRGGGSRDLSDYVVRLEEREEKLSEQKKKREELRKEIEKNIEAVQNVNEKEILTRRYLFFQNWDGIADEMNYSKRQLQRIHGNALKHYRMSLDVVECRPEK